MTLKTELTANYMQQSANKYGLKSMEYSDFLPLDLFWDTEYN